MKKWIKKILKFFIPKRILKLYRTLEELTEVSKDVRSIKIRSEILFDYIVGFNGIGMERYIFNSYHLAPADHILRYKIFADVIKEGDFVLDCASGVGYGSSYLNDYTEAHSIIGGDIDPYVVEFSKKIFGTSRLVRKRNAVSFQ